MPEPANWLRGERWAEDLPIIHSDAKGAAIAKAKAGTKATPPPPPPAANDDVPPAPRHGLPVGRHTATIVTAKVPRAKDGTTTLELSIDVGGETHPHAIVLEAGDAKAQAEGQAALERLQAALGIVLDNDTSELKGRPFTLLVSPAGVVRYEAAAEEAA